MKLWFVEPYDDELLSSWLIRTAIAQGCQPLTLTHKIWGKSWRPWTSDLDLNIDSEYLQILLSNNMSQEQLLLLTLKNENKIINSRSPQVRWITKLGIRSLDRTGGLRFCPVCLNQQAFLKKSWRLAWNVCCPQHRCLLQTICIDCSLPFSPHKLSYNRLDIRYCVRCGHDLSSQISLISSNEIFNVQRKLNSYITVGDRYSDNNLIVNNVFDRCHFFLRFLNHACAIQTVSDIRLINDLNIEVSKKSRSSENVETMSPEWLFELMKIISMIQDKSSIELALYFKEFGYTKQSFTSRIIMNRYSFNKDFLEHLPSLPRKKKQLIKKKFTHTVEPLPKEQVLEKWNQLLMKLK